MPDPTDPTRRSPSRLIVILVTVAIVVTLGALVTGFVLASRLARQSTAPATGPLAVAAAPQPGASGRYCAELMPKLPEQLIDQRRRPLIDGQPGVAAWGDPATILRCGLPDPAELTCAAQLTRFTGADGAGVEWLRLEESGAVTYLAVDRPVRIAVTVTAQAGFGPVQQLSEVIAHALPEQPVCEAGHVTPTDNS
ncbi:MAG: hypothetical protein BGO26_04255 [Actinobacteria bacterium 69-20]|jgi:hypothetical protein|nr:DUF3515 domain-containing protein [Actinomycetota bacterium]OJV24006.1 MAG: hypothetical protein BGO26_04255 [Actinobacteria bacterium 69-20]